MNPVTEAIKGFVNLIYPRSCAVCKKSLGSSEECAVCAPCVSRITTHPKPYCRLCGKTVPDRGGLCADCRRQNPSFAMARSACLYEGALKELIHLFKYNNRRSLAGLFSRYMIDFLKDDHALTEGAGLITFVPLQRKRRCERGFNQSRLLASNIAAAVGLGLADCLDKKKATRNQNELPRSDRLQNVKGAFRVRSGREALIQDQAILLIDDVMTTGSTLDECSRVLLDAGAKEVRCLTLARGS